MWWEALTLKAVCVCVCVCVTWTQKDRKWTTLLWPYSLSVPVAHKVLVCATANREPGWLCAHYSGWTEDAPSGREAAGWLPGPASSTGPGAALMRARGADGHTQGAKDYGPYPKGARERILRIKDEKGTRRDACSLSARTNMTILVRYWWRTYIISSICQNVPLGTCISYIFCASSSLWMKQEAFSVRWLVTWGSVHLHTFFV